MIHVVHHPDYVTPAPARSTYRWNKNGLIRDLLLERGEAVTWHRAEQTPTAWLEAVHDEDYVAEVLEARVPKEKERRIGFPVTAAVASRAAIVPHGTWLAACLALEHGFAANTAGGSHHALANTGAGFCVFNDLAVAAARLIDEGRVARAPCPHPSHGEVAAGPFPLPFRERAKKKARGLGSTGSLNFGRRGKAASSVGRCPPAGDSA